MIEKFLKKMSKIKNKKFLNQNAFYFFILNGLDYNEEYEFRYWLSKKIIPHISFHKISFELWINKINHVRKVRDFELIFKNISIDNFNDYSSILKYSHELIGNNSYYSDGFFLKKTWQFLTIKERYEIVDYWFEFQKEHLKKYIISNQPFFEKAAQLKIRLLFLLKNIIEYETNITILYHINNNLNHVMGHMSNDWFIIQIKKLQKKCVYEIDKNGKNEVFNIL